MLSRLSDVGAVDPVSNQLSESTGGTADTGRGLPVDGGREGARKFGVVAVRVAAQDNVTDVTKEGI